MGPSFGTEQGRGSKRGTGIGDAHRLQALHGGGIQGHSVVSEQEIAGHGSAGDGPGHEHQIPRPGDPINPEVLREPVRPGRSTKRLEVGTEAEALPDQQKAGHGDHDEGPHHIPRPRREVEHVTSDRFRSTDGPGNPQRSSMGALPGPP